MSTHYSALLSSPLTTHGSASLRDAIRAAGPICVGARSTRHAHLLAYAAAEVALVDELFLTEVTGLSVDPVCAVALVTPAFFTIL